MKKTEEKAVIEVCPLCGSKMEKGFIITREIVWNRKEHKHFDIGEKIVPPNWHLANVEAHRCKKCKLVTFRYGETGKAEREQNPKKERNGMKASKFNVLPLITATALSVAIWGLFAMWIMILFEKSYDLITVIVTSLLILVFAGSTTWESIREWRKFRRRFKNEKTRAKKE